VSKPTISKLVAAEAELKSDVKAKIEVSRSPVVVNQDAKKFDQWLDRQLQGMFDSVAEEPVPQSLIDLIKDQGKPVS
jgi:hypothetical protein